MRQMIRFFLWRGVQAPSRSAESRSTFNRRTLLPAALVLVMAAGGAAHAASGASATASSTATGATPTGASLIDKPFANHHLVLQLSDRDAAKQAMVLSVAYNLLKEYGPDAIAIEVVAFGPGIDLLRKDVPNGVRVDSLVAQGVRFSVCMNTIETIERETGKPVALNPLAHKVQAGVARILTLTEHGYTLVRP